MAEETKSTEVKLPEIKSEGSQRLTDMDPEIRLARIKAQREYQKKKGEVKAPEIQKSERSLSLANKGSVVQAKKTQPVTVDPKEQRLYNFEQEKMQAALLHKSLKKIRVNPIEEEERLKEKMRREADAYQARVMMGIGGLTIAGAIYYYFRYLKVVPVAQ